jgi:hypothetical protein
VTHGQKNTWGSREDVLASPRAAATEITNSQDINYELDFDEGDTTERGDGTIPPVLRPWK